MARRRGKRYRRSLAVPRTDLPPGTVMSTNRPTVPTNWSHYDDARSGAAARSLGLHVRSRRRP